MTQRKQPGENSTTGGGGGIRTHGSLRFTRFPSAPIRPLSHPSEPSRRRWRRVDERRLSESAVEQIVAVTHEGER